MKLWLRLLAVGLILALFYLAVSTADNAKGASPIPTPTPTRQDPSLESQVKPFKLKPIVITRTIKVSYNDAPTASQSAPTPKSSAGGLTGSIGFALSGGNCVNQAKNPAPGNPISWPVLFSEPKIGATVLFVWNHTGHVTGIWSNGDIEVGHENCPGCPTRYGPGLIRGYR